MIYRRLSRSDMQSILQLIEASQFSPPDLQQYGESVELDHDDEGLAMVRSLGEQLVDSCKSGMHPEVVELARSGDVYVLLRNLPVSVRDDVGFWRWLTCDHLLEFLLLRQRDGKLQEAIGAGSNSADILACRMFLRAQAIRQVRGDGTLDFSLLPELGRKSHDFLQSHIVRVPTGAEPLVAASLVRLQTRDRLSTEPLRDLVRDGINRTKTTVATFLMDEDEATSFTEEQWRKFSRSE